MPAMLVKQATLTARLHWRAMPNQDCLYIRLSDYFQARRHAPDRDQAPKVIADRQAPHSGRAGPHEQEGGLGDQEH